MSADHRARADIANLQRLIDLLADHVGVDMRALVAVDDHNRRGPLMGWAEQMAAGIDPRTGEPIGGDQ